MRRVNDFSELPGSNANGGDHSQNAFIENMPTERRSIADVDSNASYLFTFTKAAGNKIEVAGASIGKTDDTFYVAEGPFDNLRVAQQFIRGHKINKPGWIIEQ